MQVKQLYSADGKPTDAWWCGDCKLVYSSRRLAEYCACQPYTCACGAECEKSWMICQACVSRKRKERDGTRWSRVVKVHNESYDGPVYDEKSDQFFDSYEELIEERQNDGDEDTSRVYACTVHRVQVDADAAMGNALQDVPDETQEDGFSHVEELRTFLDEWNAKQTAAWREADTSKGVIP